MKTKIFVIFCVHEIFLALWVMQEFFSKTLTAHQKSNGRPLINIFFVQCNFDNRMLLSLRNNETEKTGCLNDIITGISVFSSSRSY